MIMNCAPFFFRNHSKLTTQYCKACVSSKWNETKDEQKSSKEKETIFLFSSQFGTSTSSEESLSKTRVSQLVVSFRKRCKIRFSLFFHRSFSCSCFENNDNFWGPLKQVRKYVDERQYHIGKISAFCDIYFLIELGMKQ